MEEAILAYGAPLLFALMLSNGFASAPPSEIVLSLAGVAAVVSGQSLVLTISVAVAGNISGALLLYCVGRLAKKERIIHILYAISSRLNFVDWHKTRIAIALDFAELFIRKESLFLLLYLRCLPVVRSIVSLPAGFARVHVFKFLWMSTIGMTIWAATWISVGAYSYDAYRQSQTAIWVSLLLLTALSFFILKRKAQQLTKSLHLKT